MMHLLVIAGTDSSGGAGLTRDTAVANDLGLRVKPVVTSVTAQSDSAFHGAHPVPPAMIATQIEAAFETNSVTAVKIGMLGTAVTAQAVAGALAGRDVPIVIDPVLRSSSGGTLYSGAPPVSLYTRATLLTPNLQEAAALTGTPVAKSPAAVVAQAKQLQQMTAGGAVLIKGGHSEHAQCTDILIDRNAVHQLSSPRISANVRGTGCTLASAIACFLARENSIHEACQKAKTYITAWIGSFAEVS